MIISDFSYSLLTGLSSFGTNCYSYLSHINPSTKSLSVFVLEPVLGFLNGYSQAKMSFNKRYGSIDTDKVNFLDNSIFTSGALPNIIAEGFKADIRTSNAIGLLTYWAGGVANSEYRTTFIADSLASMVSPSVAKRKIDTTILPYFYPPFSTYTQNESSNFYDFDKVAMQMRNTHHICFGPVHQSPDLISRFKTIETKEGSWMINFDNKSNQLNIELSPKTIFSHPLDYFPFSLINYLYPRDYKLEKTEDLRRILNDFQKNFGQSPFYRVNTSNNNTFNTIEKLGLTEFTDPRLTVEIQKDTESEYIIHSFNSNGKKNERFVQKKKTLSLLESIFRKLFVNQSYPNIPSASIPNSTIEGLVYRKEYSVQTKKPILYLTIPDEFDFNKTVNYTDSIIKYLREENISDIKIGHKFTKKSSLKKAQESISNVISLLNDISNNENKLHIDYNLYNPILELSPSNKNSLNSLSQKCDLNIYTMGYHNPNLKNFSRSSIEKDINKIYKKIDLENKDSSFNTYHINIDRPKLSLKDMFDKTIKSVSLYLWAEIEKMFIVKFFFNINLQDISLSEKIIRFLTTPLEILNTFLNITLFKPIVAVSGLVYLRTTGAEQTLFEGINEGLKMPSFNIDYQAVCHPKPDPIIFSNNPSAKNNFSPDPTLFKKRSNSF